VGQEEDQVTASVSTKAGSVDIALQAVGQATGLKMVTVPFRGGAESVTAIVGGQTDCGGNHPSEIISHIKAKRLVRLQWPWIRGTQLFPMFPPSRNWDTCGGRGIGERGGCPQRDTG